MKLNISLKILLTTWSVFFLSSGYFSQNWTWLKGANTGNPAGSYGTKGVSASGNNPSARWGAVSWTDLSGNLWLFGGSTLTGPITNDLWRYTPSNNEWTWMHGTNLTNQLPVYGTMGVASPSNMPGSTYGSVTWTDLNGNLWLFGGVSSSSSKDELWKYDITTNQWTWMKGNGTAAVHGTQGVPSAANTPGNRAYSASWTDNSNNLWLFGGGNYNDVWKYSISTNEWTWIKGSNSQSQQGSFGTQGVAAASNNPSSRETGVSWKDASGNFWIYGGMGLDPTVFAVQGWLSDVWKYDPVSNQWTWMQGNLAVNQTAVYGTLGVSSSSNTPGGRESAVGWSDPSGMLWMCSGRDNNLNFYNTLWKFDPATSQWTWMKGANTANQTGTYGTQGVTGTSNTPGSRFRSSAWMDQVGNFYYFGGLGYHASGTGRLNDLWKYDNCVVFPQAPSSISGTTSLCSGSSAVYSVAPAAGATSYSWTLASGWSGTSLTNTINIVGGSSSNTILVRSVNACGTSSAQTASITVNPLPTVTITGASTICNGNSLNLTAGGATTYSWSTTQTTADIVVSPAVQTSYTVTGTDGNGCMNTSVQTVTVNPTPTISVNSGTICSGNIFTVNATGAASYTMSDGVSTSTNAGSLTYTALGNTNYTIQGMNSFGCVSAPVISSSTVHARPVIIGSVNVICNGETFSISPVTNAYSLSITGGSFVVTPSVTTVYTISGSSIEGCDALAPGISTVVVVPLPTVSVNSGSICSGNSFVITASGALSYSVTGNTFTVNPASSSSYTITGYNGSCVSASPAVSSVTVHATPVISVNSGSICAGQTFVLNATGASSYNFPGGSATVSPVTTTFYPISGTSSAGCVSTVSAISSVTVNPLPIVTVNSGSICNGGSFTIVPGGAASYVPTGGSFVVAPSVTTSYSVTGTSSLGCVGAAPAISTVTVHQLPVIGVNSGSICAGQSFTLAGSGASGYGYPGGSPIVAPLTSTTYPVSGTSSVGCVSSNIATATITVHGLPTVSVNSGTVCSGNVFTIVASGASSYIIQGGSSTVIPVSNTSYTVAGTSSVGCASSNTVASTVTVLALPVVNISGGAVICLGATATLQASGANTYLWNTTATTAINQVSPGATTTYTLVGTDLNGCQGSATAIVTVNPLPLVTASASSTVICQGNSVTLNGGGALTYAWSGGITNAVPFSPAVSGSYTVTGTDVNGCTNGTQVVIVVNSLPHITASASSTMICTGQSVVLNGGGGSTYNWSGGVTNNASFFPTTTTVYSVTGTDANNCQNSATISVVVNPLPPVTASSNNSTICAGESATLSSAGANTYSWSVGPSFAVITVTPALTTTYTVTGTDANGCANTAVLVQVVDLCTGLVKENTGGFFIYPNPTSRRFYLRTEESVFIKIRNSLGQVLHESQLNPGDHFVDLGEEPNGIYMIEAKQDRRIVVLKLIKE